MTAVIRDGLMEKIAALVPRADALRAQSAARAGEASAEGTGETTVSRRLHITSFHGFKKSFSAVFWLIAAQNLVDVSRSPIKRKRKGAELACFGCATIIEPGEQYQTTFADRKAGLGAHPECVAKLIEKAKEVEAQNGLHFTERETAAKPLRP